MKPRILIVEDDETLRMTFLRFLAARGYRVDGAGAYAEAMALFGKGCDLVVADIVLEGRTGIDLLRELRSVDPDCPVVLMTGYPTLETAVEAVRLGACEYLLKPVEKEALLESVARGVARRRDPRPEAPPPDRENRPLPLSIHTLGRFEIFKDDKPLVFAGKVQRKPLELLKALIALGGTEVPERRLTDFLWPEADGDVAHSAFTTTLSRLRNLLGVEGAVSVREGCVTLDRRRCRVDCSAFEQAVKRFENACREGNEPDGLYPLAEKSLRIYSGPFLPAEENLPWATPYRERLRSRFRRVAEAAGELLEGAGNREEAIRHYRQALEADELAERLYQRLILCCAQSGRRSEAIEAYRLCRVVLDAHGIGLSSETEELFRKITAM